MAQQHKQNSIFLAKIVKLINALWGRLREICILESYSLVKWQKEIIWEKYLEETSPKHEAKLV